MRYSIATADAVKGRVRTTFDQLANDTYEVRQVIDGHTMYVEQFATRLGAADAYAFMRSRARRELHAYESDTKPEGLDREVWSNVLRGTKRTA